FGYGATALDLLRGIAWLASFPLLTHGLWGLLEMEGEGRRPNPLWLVPGYATLALFVPAASQAWRTGSYLLAEVAKPIFPLNLLRLSMSYRSLRRFLGLVGLVGMVMLVGTAMGAGGTPELRRLVAWGILAALLAAAVYTPLQQAALRRFAWLRRLLGVSITAE